MKNCDTLKQSLCQYWLTKKRICHQVDFAIQVDHTEESKIIDRYFDLARELQKTV